MLIPKLYAQWYLKMIEYQSVFKPEFRKRTWRKRLFSWPWKPFRKYEIVEPEINNDPQDRVHIRTRPDIGGLNNA